MTKVLPVQPAVTGEELMGKFELRAVTSAFAIAAFAATAGQALAQSATRADDKDLGLDEIVVTASGGDRNRLNTAAAITSVDASIVENLRPASESEIYRLIPGIQAAGTAGPGGNSNIAVRGLPVATGGSPFVQLQEDGLPTVLFGDIQFGNNDYWTRYDATVERLESIRGGTATTFASQAPGAIINYISHTGREAGGFVEGVAGIDFKDYRLNFRYGAPIGETTRFHIGGLYHTGNGPLNRFRVSDSIQLKANLTQEFGDGASFARIYLKFADTQEPNYTGSPALATKTGNKITNLTPFPGFDGRSQNNYSNLNRTGLFLNRAGTALERQPIDGITTKQFSIGGKIHYEFGDNFTIDNDARWSSVKGAFAAPFLNVSRRAGLIGSQLRIFDGTNIVNNQDAGRVYATIGSVRYASGPLAGQEYTGTYVDNNVNVRTNIRDMGSLANNLTLAGKFDSNFAKITARAGFFYMRQNIDLDWHVNKSLREVNGNNPSQLDLYSAPGAAGVKLTQEGISGYNNNWGSCCARDYDLTYTNTAPFVQLDLDSDSFALDGSVRFERVKAKGSGTAGGTVEAFINSGGVNIPFIRANGAREVVNYARSYTSWTAGALWKASTNASLFVRASRGGRFNGDRQTFGGKFTTTGALCTSAQATTPGTTGCTADGVTPSVDFINQYEIGLKNRGDLGGARYSLEVSLLKANFKQSTFELSATRCPGGAGGCIIDKKYRSTGAEFYGSLSAGGLSLVANATYSDAKELNAGAANYTRAAFLPDLTYTVSASYDVADMATLGIAATGQSGITDGTNTYPGGMIFNSNIAFRPIQNIEVGVQAYNLFNRLDFRGNGNTVADPSVTPVVVTGTPVIGQTFTGSVKFKF
jgi:outer membrane receptor protein involved in Fe transport